MGEKGFGGKRFDGKRFVITDDNAGEYILKMGAFVRDIVTQARRKGVVLGMSGGIDCSVVARLCQEAGVYVKLLMLPDDDNMKMSSSHRDALALIDGFGFDYEVCDIGKACRAVESELGSLSDLSRMNIRPRMRMIVLYAAAQSVSCFVIGTGNLDERLLGYFTKWGDGASDLNPLGLLTKGEVRILARYLGVPKAIVDKPASAGLFEGQTDEEELGISYDLMDAFILKGTSGNAEVDGKIEQRIEMSRHKLEPIRVFGECCSLC
ncbi:MAG: NAD(+) synthase [Peptococcaceae bacterium]|nr:NAD(+) synthase [Peptococcaceae bacterium]